MGRGQLSKERMSLPIASLCHSCTHSYCKHPLQSVQSWTAKIICCVHEAELSLGVYTSWPEPCIGCCLAKFTLPESHRSRRSATVFIAVIKLEMCEFVWSATALVSYPGIFVLPSTSWTALAVLSMPLLLPVAKRCSHSFFAAATSFPHAFSRLIRKTETDLRHVTQLLHRFSGVPLVWAVWVNESRHTKTASHTLRQ